MKMLLNEHKSRRTYCNKGMALLFVLMVMIVLTSVVGAYLGFVQLSTKSTGAQIIESQAFYLADAGIHYGIYNLKQDSGWSGTPSPVSLGEGTLSVSVIDLGGGDYQLTSTGTVDGQSRTLRQDVNSAVMPKYNTWQEME
jgi:type II secretory pathway component PulK